MGKGRTPHMCIYLEQYLTVYVSICFLHTFPPFSFSAFLQKEVLLVLSFLCMSTTLWFVIITMPFYINRRWSHKTVYFVPEKHLQNLNRPRPSLKIHPDHPEKNPSVSATWSLEELQQRGKLNASGDKYTLHGKPPSNRFTFIKAADYDHCTTWPQWLYALCYHDWPKCCLCLQGRHNNVTQIFLAFINSVRCQHNHNYLEIFTLS